MFFILLTWNSLLGCGLAARRSRKKLVHDAHEYFVEVPELEGKSFKKRIWNYLGASFIPKCDLCISVNKELADILSKKYRNTFHVIRSVPYLSKINEERKKENGTPVVLYQGVIE